MLIRALGETNRRLEDLTAGEVDTVTDRQGHSFLLQRAQERWRQSAVEKQAAIIDALPAHIALLNAEGVILSANESWRQFTDGNALLNPRYAVGSNYLEICDSVRGEAASDASQAAAGIRSVFRGGIKSFSMEYACESATEKRWFLFTATPVDDRLDMGAVVMHLDISENRRSEENLHRFEAAMNASPDAIFLIDRPDMRIVYANEAARRMQELDSDQILELKPWDAIDVSREALENIYDAIILGGGFAEPMEMPRSVGNAAPRWTEVRRHAQRIGGRWTIVVLVRDVTARKEAEQRIAYLNRVYAVMSGINALIVRARGRDELFREACRIAVDDGELAMAWIGMVDTAHSRVELQASAGMPEEFRSAVTEQNYSTSTGTAGNSLPMRILSERKRFVSNDSQNDRNVYLRALHVKYGINSIAKFPLIVADKAVGVLVFYARERGYFQEEQLRLLTDLASDVAFAIAQIESRDRLDYLSYYDVVTGLANRTLFLERAAQYVQSAASGGHKLALCLIDLERFKNINDSLGRGVGDSLLKQVGQWLASDTGDANIVARVDADRFAIVMPKVEDEEQVAWRLERSLRAFLSHSFTLNDTAYRIAAKTGVAMYPADGGNAETLFKHAEVALKRAKAGGDRFLFYAQKMTETVVGRLDLENWLRRALELDEFVLHYQPKVDVASGKLVGVEALIRWNDPRTGLVPPGQFIPILEETGLIHDVGRWALNKAMEDYLRWRNAGLPAVRVAVNLSPLQLRNRDFVANMQQVISVDANAAAGLELELTESLIMEDVRLSIANLRAIRAMGIRIAIDDFGTGFSSLSYLSKLPIDTVKIDRSFVTDMVTGAEGLTLISIIINLAHSLKLKVVAEGVETEEQSRLLRLLTCDEMQGFFVSEPLTAAMFEKNYLTAR